MSKIYIFLKSFLKYILKIKKKKKKKLVEIGNYQKTLIYVSA